MLLAFRASNARSFRDEFELSLVATKLAAPGVAREIPRTGDGKTVEVLPSAALFGPNASGKSNLLSVLHDLRANVVNSFRRAPGDGTTRVPFLLDPAASQEPTRFEVDLVIGGVEYQYLLEVDDERVLAEQAWWFPKGRRALLFERDLEGMHFGAAARADGRAAERVLRPDALFLSTAAATGHPLLRSLHGWFQRNLLFAEESSRLSRQVFTASLLDEPEVGEAVRGLVRAADLGIAGARSVSIEPADRERLARVVHILRGEEGEPDPDEALPFEIGVRLTHEGTRGDVELQPDEESLGTLVWLGLAGPVVHALLTGSVLLADELDASLHPTLVRRLVDLFQDSERNPNRAQLIFNTHDATLLPNSRGDGALGRDQVWFTEKLPDGRTRLTALADFGPRRDEAVRNRYLAGRYGAVPITTPAAFDPIATIPSAR